MRISFSDTARTGFEFFSDLHGSSHVKQAQSLRCWRKSLRRQSAGSIVFHFDLARKKFTIGPVTPRTRRCALEQPHFPAEQHRHVRPIKLVATPRSGQSYRPGDAALRKPASAPAGSRNARPPDLARRRRRPLRSSPQLVSKKTGPHLPPLLDCAAWPGALAPPGRAAR